MIGSKIKELRISRGWTTRGFAEKLGVAHAMVHKYELGGSQPRPGMLEKIAKLFGVTLAELTDSKPVKITGIKFDAQRFEQALSDSRQLDEESKTLINLLIDKFLEKKKLQDYKNNIEKLT